MTDKEYVIAKYPDAKACCGDNPYSCVIVRPGQILSRTFPPDKWDEDLAEEEAWRNAARKIKSREKRKESPDA